MIERHAPNWNNEMGYDVSCFFVKWLELRIAAFPTLIRPYYGMIPA
jgi:hypothetical protein